MEIYEKIIAAKAKEFDALRKVYFPSNIKLRFLKISESEDEFETVLELTKNWFSGYSAFRDKTRVEIARNAELQRVLDETTHLAIGEDIYVITPRDTVRPQGKKCWWRIYCEQYVNRNQFSSLY